MAKFKLTPAARADLKDIGRYSREQYGKDAADRYLHGFASAFRRLGDHPNLAPLRAEIGHDIRCLTKGRHHILYQVVGGGVLVVRIIHHAQRTPRLDQ